MRILALVPEADCTRACLDAAAAAAASQQDGRVVALHVRVDPLSLTTGDEEVAIQRLRDAREGSAKQRAAGIRAHVEEWKRTAPPQLARLVTYDEVVGGEEEQVLQASRNAELLVMARPRNLDGHDAFHAAVFLSRRPLLLAPADWRPQAGADLESHVLIAWNEGEQAARAVEGAMPWLKTAAKVSILTVRKSGRNVDSAPFLESLKREGVTTQLIEADPVLGRTSARIIATAKEVGASLIVLGAYRYGSLVAWALGATTRRTIAQSEIPMMLAH